MLMKTNWSKIRFIASIFLILAVLTAVVFYVKANLESFLVIKQISAANICIIAFFVMVNFIAIGLTLKIVLAPFRVKLRFREWFGLTMLTSLGNLFVPAGGLGMRAVYLKKVHNFQYTHFLSTFAAVSIIDILLFGLIGILGLLYIFWQKGFLHIPLLIVFISVIGACLTALWLSPGFKDSKNRFIQKIINVFRSWSELKKEPGIIRKLFFTTGLNLVSSIFIYFFILRSLGLNISYPEAFLPAALGDYGAYIRILPASFGFFEGGVIFSSQVIGASTAQAVLAAALVRIIVISWTIVLGLFFAWVLIWRKK